MYSWWVKGNSTGDLRYDALTAVFFSLISFFRLFFYPVVKYMPLELIQYAIGRNYKLQLSKLSVWSATVLYACNYAAFMIIVFF